MSDWILVFDTETTGVGPNYRKLMTWAKANELSNQLASGKEWEKNIELWRGTHIAQLSYVMYNLTTNEYKIFNKYISDIDPTLIEQLLDPARISLSEKQYNSSPNSYTHPITVATLQKSLRANESEKATIGEAMSEFMSDLEMCQVAAAHNAVFDRQLVFCELARLADSKLFNDFNSQQNKMYCTMCIAKDIVHIDTKILKDGEISRRIAYMEKVKKYSTPESKRYDLVDEPAIKSPALWEVYDRLFGYPPDESSLHDAIVDVIVCLRVFYRLWMTGNTSLTRPLNLLVCGSGEPDIYGKDVETGGQITDYISSITPPGIDAQANFDPTQGLGMCFVEGEPYLRIPGQSVSHWKETADSEENQQIMSGPGGKRKTKKRNKTKRNKIKKTKKNKTKKNRKR